MPLNRSPYLTVIQLAACVLVPAPPALRGSYQGALMFSHATGSFLGPLGGGWLLASLGPGSLWLTCGAAGTLAALLFLRGQPRSTSGNSTSP